MDPNSSMIHPHDLPHVYPQAEPYDYQDEPYYYQDVNFFRQLVMEDKWEDVIKFYEDVFFHKIKIKGRGTALHVAVSNGNKDVVKSLVDAIVKHDDLYHALTLFNERGATPLHLAAYRGLKSMCECIVGNGERRDLIQVKNANGETPLFWAVLARKKKPFLYLRNFFPDDLNIVMNNDDTTILHVAIRREMFGLANIIMHLYPVLSSTDDKDEVSPLEILATRTSAFESGNKLSWWEQILYYCMSVKVRDAKAKMEFYEKGDMSKSAGEKEKRDQSEISIPLNNDDELEKAGTIRLDFNSRAKILCYRIQKFVLMRWLILFSSPKKRQPTLSLGTIKRLKKKHIFGRQLLKSFMEKPYESYMVGGADPFGDREDDAEMKEKFENFATIKRKMEESTMKNNSKQNQEMENSAKNVEKDTTFLAAARSGIVEIVEELNSKVPNSSEKKGLLLVAMKNIERDELSPKKTLTKNTAYLIAAKHGITEMMRELESNLKSVIYETNSNNENALILAVKHRQPHVVEGLWKRFSTEIFQTLNLQVDNNENTILHLAAYRTIHNENPAWRISGAAMQMMWDIKWFKYIKGLVPDHFHHRGNKEGKTPGEIFKEQHKELLQQSIEWLKDTSESCSVVAALVAGVSFATSGSVPGGNDQETGKPTFEGQPAFEGFAVSSLIGLYFSVTALIMFLSILTSRKQVEDFKRNLPMKLLFGLSSLFVSIVAMFISFIAGHYYVLTDKYTKGGNDLLFYLYIAICLPITFYAVVQFPLYADLVKVIWKKVPPASIKGVQL